MPWGSTRCSWQWELVVESGVPSAEHVLDVLAWLNPSPIPQYTEATLQLKICGTLQRSGAFLRKARTGTDDNQRILIALASARARLRVHGFEVDHFVAVRPIGNDLDGVFSVWQRHNLHRKIDAAIGMTPDR